MTIQQDEPHGAGAAERDRFDVARGGPQHRVTDLPGDPASPIQDKFARHLSETAWVARAQTGDPHAFDHLVEKYQAELFRLCYRMLSDRGDAEDVVQDVFVVMWRQLPRLTDAQAFHSWIYKTATRRCLNAIRQRTRQRTLITEEHELEAVAARAISANNGHQPEKAAQANAMWATLEEALADLPPDLRVCWVLNQLHSLTYPQIAEIIGAPLSTVRGRISRARQILMKGMAAWQ